VRLPGWLVSGGHLQYPHPRDEDPANGQKNGFHTILGHPVGLQQRQSLYSLLHIKHQEGQPILSGMDRVLLHRQILPPAPSGVSKSLRTCCGGHPSGLNCLCPPVCHISLLPPSQNPLWSHTGLSGRLCSHNVIGIRLPQHPDATKTIRPTQRQRINDGGGFLNP